MKSDPATPLNATLLALSEEVERWKARASEFHDQVIHDDEADAARKEPDDNGMVLVTFRVFPGVVASEDAMHSLERFVSGLNALVKGEMEDPPVSDPVPPPSPVKELPPMPDDGI